MKRIKFGLLPRIVVAIILGILCGDIMPDWAARGFMTFNGLFNQFLGFIIPLMILGLVAPAIADIGRGAGRMLAWTVLLAYMSTLIGGVFSYCVGDMIYPQTIGGKMAVADVVESVAIQPYFAITLPAMFDVMSAIVLAFIIGLGVTYLQGDVLRRAVSEFRTIMMMVIESIVLPLLPLYIFGIFMNMAVTGDAYRMVNLFLVVVVVNFIIHIVWLLMIYLLGGALTKRNPFRLLVTMLPAYFTALGTQSSAATIPVTLRQVCKLGVSDQVASFVVPLCATIHLSGSMLKIVSCSLALIIMKNMPYDFAMFFGFICMLGITVVAAPGVPGGVIMASLGILSSMLGFTAADQAVMISLYIAMDSFGTACNVTGDGVLSLIIDKYFKQKEA